VAITLKDIARLSGVSTATVSHVLNGTRYVSEETKKKVLTVINNVGYRANTTARSLRSKKSNNIGLIVPDVSNSFFADIIEMTAKNLNEKGYNLILANSDENIDIEKEQIKILSNQIIDGLIIAPTTKDHSYINYLVDDNYPIVFIDRKPMGYTRDCVLTDNEGGSYEAISAFIEHGHNKIGIITGLEGLTTTDERLNGYKRAHVDHGIPINYDLIKYGDSKYKSGYMLTRELIDEGDITSLYIGNNSMTIGAVNYLVDMGIKVPDEICLIGFDDYDWAKITNPSLTVVRQPISDISKMAVKLILKRINEGGTDYKDYRLPTEIIYRDSFSNRNMLKTS
jgi:LacI family transcriptional regulator